MFPLGCRLLGIVDALKTVNATVTGSKAVASKLVIEKEIKSTLVCFFLLNVFVLEFQRTRRTVIEYNNTSRESIIWGVLRTTSLLQRIYLHCEYVELRRNTIIKFKVNYYKNNNNYFYYYKHHS